VFARQKVVAATVSSLPSAPSAYFQNTGSLADTRYGTVLSCTLLHYTVTAQLQHTAPELLQCTADRILLQSTAIRHCYRTLLQYPGTIYKSCFACPVPAD